MDERILVPGSNLRVCFQIKGNIEGWSKIYRAEGFRGVFTGWSPTFFGYSVRTVPDPYRNIHLTSSSRLKVLSNTGGMNSSSHSTVTWSGQRKQAAGRRHCIWPRVHRRSSLPILHSVRLKRSRFECRLPCRPLRREPSMALIGSPAKRVPRGKLI